MAVHCPCCRGPWPVLHAWGDADDLVPAAAYEQFAQRAQHRTAPYCALRLAGADHGLQAGKWMACSRCGPVEGWGRALPARAVRQRDLVDLILTGPILAPAGARAVIATAQLNGKQESAAHHESRLT
jgi:hypothetical protein